MVLKWVRPGKFMPGTGAIHADSGGRKPETTTEVTEIVMIPSLCSLW